MTITCGFKRTIGLALLVASFGGHATAATDDDIVGLWYDDKREGAISISKCGDRICGHIVWLKKPLRKDGTPLVDVRNVSKSQRTRAICGIQILGSLKQANAKKWGSGWVYSPRRGKRYRVQLTLKNKRTLDVRGYVKFVALGQTDTWTRAPANLKRCASVSKSAPTQAAGKPASEQKGTPPKSAPKIAAPKPRVPAAE